MMVACLLPDERSPNVIKRSVMPFRSSECGPTKPCSATQSTAESRILCLLTESDHIELSCMCRSATTASSVSNTYCFGTAIAIELLLCVGESVMI